MIEQVQSLPGVDEPPPSEQSTAAVVEPPQADLPPPPAPPSALDQVAARIAATVQSDREDQLAEAAAAASAWRALVARMASGDGELSQDDADELVDAGRTLGIEPKDVAAEFRHDVETLQTFRAYTAELSQLRTELPSLQEKASAAREELKRLPKIAVELRKEISRMEGAARRISDLAGFEIERLVRQSPRLRLTAE